MGEGNIMRVSICTYIEERRVWVDSRIPPRNKACGGFRAVSGHQIDPKNATIDGCGKGFPSIL
jgi:hypothetical protein